jgi:hemoglobin/transferrin/lactoferrin receptor protein
MTARTTATRLPNRPTLKRLPPVLFLALSAFPLGAQTTPTGTEVVELAPFKVTAEGAQSVLQITQRDLEQRQANDLEDALSLDPSITVGGSTGVAQKIYVRNLGEGLINVSVDGATQSGSLFHHIGRIAIEPELLKQVEVQPGTGNAADGPGALGGAIRFVTKDPLDLLQPGESAGALLKYGNFSNTRGWKASATGYGRANANWSGLASIVSSEHEEIEDGDGNRLPGSDTRQNVVLGKVVGTFGDGHTLRLGFESLDEVGNKLRRPEWAPGPGNPVFYMESNRQTGTLGYEINPSNHDWLNLRLSLSHTAADVLQIATFGP